MNTFFSKDYRKKTFNIKESKSLYDLSSNDKIEELCKNFTHVFLKCLNKIGKYLLKYIERHYIQRKIITASSYQSMNTNSS